MDTSIPAWMRCCLLVAAVTVGGCRSGGPSYIPTERDRREMLALMLPQEIKIWPFTKITSFDDDDVPDGILAVIRPLDRFGDPVKAVGMFYFELWTYEKASGERKGERIEFWDRTIATAEDVRLYWTHGQTYEFQLAAKGGDAIRPGRKYVLTATYRTPWDETIQDEYVIDFHLPAGSVPEASEPLAEGENK